MFEIRMQEAALAGELHEANWDLAIIGDAIDSRGEAALAFIKSRSYEQNVAQYEPDAFRISIEGDARNAERCSELLSAHRNKRIVLEATTLGFVEIYLCAKALKGLGATGLSLLYVEPREYTRTSGQVLLNRREFELSAEVPGFKGIPGATLLTGVRSTQRTVFFLGFEERRLDVAMQTQLIEPAETHVVFGVPAFSPGWEMHSFANNIRVIQDSGIEGGVHFCGAENPAATYALLDEIKGSLAPRERLIISPIGTKPCGIGVALFAATHEDVGLLYDHPKRSPKRTESLTRWHLFDVEL